MKFLAVYAHRKTSWFIVFIMSKILFVSEARLHGFTKLNTFLFCWAPNAGYCLKFKIPNGIARKNRLKKNNTVPLCLTQSAWDNIMKRTGYIIKAGAMSTNCCCPLKNDCLRDSSWGEQWDERTSHPVKLGSD